MRSKVDNLNVDKLKAVPIDLLFQYLYYVLKAVSVTNLLTSGILLITNTEFNKFSGEILVQN